MKHASLLLPLAFVACGKGKSSDPAPAKPADGAPLAVVAGAVTPGESHSGAVAVKAYNFSAKPVAQYSFLIRYHDASGALIKVKQGTPFEAAFDHWSVSGRKYKCEPTSWCEFKLDSLDVPATAKTADVIVDRVTALKDDVKFEDAPLFSLPGTDWPDSMK